MDVVNSERGFVTAKSEPDTEPIDGSLTTFEGARREQMRRWAEMPLERIIFALEGMESLANRLAASEASP